MLDFRPISLSDKELFNRFAYRCGEKNCDLAFANIFCWSDYYKSEICEWGGFLIGRFRIDGKDKIGYTEPLGEGDIAALFNEIRADARSNGQPLRMQSLSPEFIDKISSNGVDPDILLLYTNRDYYDYIYSAESLRSLSGKKLQPKRNHINQFQRNYDYQFVTLKASHKDEVLSLLRKWQESKHEDFRKFLVEVDVIKRGMEYFDQLGLFGGAIYVDGRMIAFTYGSPINDNTFCIHIEKADVDFESSFPMINKLFINSLPDQYLYINREEDMGIYGLRESKLSYHPQELYKKWYIIDKESKEAEVWGILEQGYRCDAATIARFLTFFYNDEGTYIRHKNNIPISAIFSNNIKNEYGDICFIYGLTVLPAYRGSRISQEVVFSFFKTSYQNGDTLALILVPCMKFDNLCKSLGFYTVSTNPSVLDMIGSSACFYGQNSAENLFLCYRIINVEKYLKRYILYFPPATPFSFTLYDSVVPENSGEYLVSDSRVDFIPSSDETGTINPYELYNMYPLDGDKFEICLQP